MHIFIFYLLNWFQKLRFWVEKLDGQSKVSELTGKILPFSLENSFFAEYREHIFGKFGEFYKAELRKINKFFNLVKIYGLFSILNIFRNWLLLAIFSNLFYSVPLREKLIIFESFYRSRCLSMESKAFWKSMKPRNVFRFSISENCT